MNELGELRPSQLIFTFGVGSLIDLPNMSALVMGLDDWDTRYCTEVRGRSAVAAIQRRLGSQVSTLYLPPIKLDGMSVTPRPQLLVFLCPISPLDALLLLRYPRHGRFGRLQARTGPVPAGQDGICSPRVSQGYGWKAAVCLFRPLFDCMQGRPPDRFSMDHFCA